MSAGNIFLIRDSNILFLNLPQGKPDFNASSPEDRHDTQLRVLQPPQEGPNCYWYAMNMLRSCVDKNAASEHTRKIEKTCTDLSKERTAFQITWDVYFPKLLAKLEAKGWLPDRTRNTISNTLSLLEPFLQKHEQPQVLQLLKDFCTQTECDSLDTYKQRRQNSLEIEVYMTFFQSLGISPKDSYQGMARLEIEHALKKTPERETNPADYMDQYPTWKFLMQSHAATAVLQSIALIEVSRELGFIDSSWKPSEPIEKLTECLASEGPLLVGGRFGEAMYGTNAPTLFESAPLPLLPPVYAWKSSDRLPAPEAGDDGHAIVIIGTRIIDDRAFVYFVDPKDGSDPQNPFQRKTYMISYKNLVENIKDRKGNTYSASEDSCYSYAIYFPE